MGTLFGLAWWGWLVIGLLIGLIAEWLFDRWSNRRELCALRATNDALREENTRIAADAAAGTGLRAEADGLRTELVGLRTAHDRLSGDLRLYEGDVSAFKTGGTNLALKTGLGAGLGAWLLSTFGKGTPDELKAELDGLRSQNATLMTDLANCRASGVQITADLNGARGELKGYQDDLVALQSGADSGALKTGLGAALGGWLGLHYGKSNAADLRAELEGLRGQNISLTNDLSGVRAELEGLRGQNISLSADLAAARQAPSGNALALGAMGAVLSGETDTDPQTQAVSLHSPLDAEPALRVAPLGDDRRDPLVDINGIGRVYERKLFDSGIFTFKQLSELTPDAVRAIIKPEGWQEIDAAAWIAAAKQRISALVSGRDPLIDINGIGPVYERKLFDAGVLTFKQLSELTPDAIRAIIKPQPWQEFEPLAWIAEAAEFAKKYNG